MSASPYQELVLQLRYPPGSVSRRYTWLYGRSYGNGSDSETSSGGLRPAPMQHPPTIGDGSAHGDYNWDPQHAVLHVKMRAGGRGVEAGIGGGPGVTLEVRTEPAAMVRVLGLRTYRSLYRPPLAWGFSRFRIGRSCRMQL